MWKARSPRLQIASLNSGDLYPERHPEIVAKGLMMVRVFFIMATIFCSLSLGAQPETREPAGAESAADLCLESPGLPKYFQDEATKARPAQAVDIKGSFTKMAVLLVGICAVTFAAALLFKKITNGRFDSFSSSGSIRLLERKYLSPRTSVWLLEVLGQPMLVVENQNSIAAHPLDAKKGPTQ